MTFLDNVKDLPKMFSFWVMFIVTNLTAWWLMQPLEWQAEILLAYPMLKLGAPAISLVSFMIARAKPQGL